MESSNILKAVFASVVAGANTKVPSTISSLGMGSVSLSKYNGEQLLIEVVEEKAKWLKHHTFLRYPADKWKKNGYSIMTWGQFADAINKVAHWLDQQLGKSMDNEAVAYLGPSNARYSIILPAAIKTNRKEGIKNLIGESQCKAWIYAEDDENQTKALGISDRGPKLLTFPSLEWCLDSEGHERYPYDKIYDQAKFEEILFIHTSGTTTNSPYERILQQLHNLLLFLPKHWPLWKDYANLVPSSMAGGLHAYIFAPAFNGTSIIPPHDEIGISPAIFKKIIQLNPVDGIQCPPHAIAQLYNDPETQPLLKSLKYIIYLGASLGQRIRDDLYELVIDLSMRLLQCRVQGFFSARKDDLTKLDWLAKFHAQDIKTRIKQHPDVLNVIVGGEGRSVPYFIIESRDGVLDRNCLDSVLDELYSDAIVQASKDDIKEIKIAKKDYTLLRKEIEKDYVAEIKDAYERFGKAKNR
ncbi:acetyl-CoA synthetase-like protein [Lindgomyces ingoldianus]|uniref:Acetyl-CoA synthetase-like protein n=1 Tax=Lindgomyces ingoldianus TaxID=673940 RepID=A0ACB6QEW4_9PLEO|nr:acetyl-CoA synthetase-like protein [Lindgomyces ingoldianus]KAF2464690.1 acetyl-CoA synthetase-like protein [Lindgomyces ingoldianus]